MANDVYLQIEGIKGESTDDKHKDWIEVSHVAAGVHQPCAMKKLLLLSACFLFSGAQAAELKCPGHYPSKETALLEKPAGHEGGGLVRGGKLSSAYIFVGKLHADPNGFEAMQLVPKKVKGGWDTEDSFSSGETKWLVCIYGGDGRSSAENPRVAGSIEWWEKIDASIGHCTLHFREVRFPAGAPSDWTATAACR